MAKKRKKDKEKKRPLFFLKMSLSYNMGGLVVLVLIGFFLVILASSMIVVGYQNYERNMKEGRLEKTLEYLFPNRSFPTDPPWPKQKMDSPRPERGKGASLSTSFQETYGWDTKYSNLVSFAVIYHSSQYKMNIHLVKRVIKVESDGDPFAVSPKNCYSLMQVHEMNYSGENKYHPWVNVREGVKILAPLVAKHGVYGGLLAYNGSSPKNPYFESIVFARKVLDGI